MKHEAFVRAWQRSDCVADVARQLAISHKEASRMACRLRGYGIPLKKMRGGIDRIDVEALKRIAEEAA